MNISLNYVSWIQENKITLFCEDKEKRVFLMKLGARRKFFDRKTWTIVCKDESDLAKKLQLLNENNFMFDGGSRGWNAVSIFIFMREKNLVSGKVTEIVWSGPDQVQTRLL